jgi:hypothetical protein
MRGLWAERMSLFVPGMKIKSVSLEGNVGAGGVETFATSTTAAFEFTGARGQDEPDGLMAPAVPGGPEAPTATGEPKGPDRPEAPEVPAEPDESEALAEPNGPEARGAVEPDRPNEPEGPGE